MEVILRKDVDNLGFEFEVVTVKPGYARNFLIPQGLASLATPKAKEALGKTLEERKQLEAGLIAEAQEKSTKLDDLKVKLDAKVGAGSDKLFGSVNNQNLAEALQKAGVEIERKNIKIPGNTIKRLGTYTAKIRFHREVETEFTFEVIPDADSIAKIAAAAKAKAEVAKLDAERAEAAKNAEDESSFTFDNPLLTKEEKEAKEEVAVEETTEAVAETTETVEETTTTEESSDTTES